MALSLGVLQGLFSELEKIASFSGQSVLLAARHPEHPVGDLMYGPTIDSHRWGGEPGSPKFETVNNRANSIERGGKSNSKFYPKDNRGILPDAVAKNIAEHRLVRAAKKLKDGKLKFSRGTQGGTFRARFHGNHLPDFATATTAAHSSTMPKANSLLRDHWDVLKANPGKALLGVGAIGGLSYAKAKLKERRKKQEQAT